MPTRTIDLLLNLEAKPKSVKDLTSRFKELEKQAEQTRVLLNKATDPKQAARLGASLNNIEMEMRDINREAGKRTLEKSLKAAQDQANKTREKMEKLAQVGTRLTLVGGAIVAPFALAVRKYVETVGEGEATSKRILELQKRWTESQVRLGRVTAEIVLPTLEKALDIVDKITAFAEKNPEAVKAAVGIGASLVVLGGIVTTTAQIVSTISTVQGLLAGVGVGGTAAAGGAAGMSAAVSAGVVAGIQAVGIAAAVLLILEGSRRLVNWALGTDTTWSELGETARQLFIISVEGWKLLPGMFVQTVTDLSKQWREITTKLGQILLNGVKVFFTSLGQSIVNGFKSFGTAIQNGFGKIASALGFKQSSGAQAKGSITRKAAGGYIGTGLFMGGEQGREFVLSNSTTRAAESVMGGALNQQNLIRALAGGGNKRVSYYDARKFDSVPSAETRRMMKEEILSALAGAL